MALTLPILLMVVFGIAQFGIAYNNYIMLTDSVRVGARQLAISRGQTEACTKARDRVYASAATLTSSAIALSMTIAGATYGYPGSACASGIGTTMIGGDDVTLRATYPCGLNIMGINYAPGCTLRSQSTARIE